LERAFLAGKNKLHAVLSRILTRTAVLLDYDQLPPAVFVKMMKEAVAMRAGGDETFPLVALGHAKGMPNGDNLRGILQLARAEFGDRLCFWTVREAVDHYFKNAQKSDLNHTASFPLKT
jgi:hypothetical protein